MAIAFANVIRFTAVSAGIASFVVASAPTGAVTPAQAAAIDGAVYPYYAQSADGSQWEYGSGAFTRATQTLARSTITSTSNGDTNPVNFTSAPIVDVFQAPAQGLQQSGAPLVLDNDTASFSNGDITVKDNPWNKGSLVRGTDYLEKLYVIPGTFPSQIKMEWVWPSGSAIGDIYSYPLLIKDYPAGAAISTYSNIMTTFDFSYSGSGNDPTNPNQLAFDVLHETWLLNPADVEVMVMMVPRDVLPRTDLHPYTSISATTLGVPATYDVESFIDGWQKIICYPTTHQLGSADNQFSNPTLSGSVAGTPGTDPTACSFATMPAGLTKTIVGAGTTTAADGSTVNYVDVQISGTPSAGGTGFFEFYVNGASYTRSPPNQNWIVAFYLAVTAGSLANVGNIQISNTYLDTSQAYLYSGATVGIQSSLTATPQKFLLQSVPSVLTAPFVGYIAPSVNMAFTAGLAVNFTLRVASPMFAWDNQKILTQGKLDWKALFNALVSAGMLTGAEVLSSIQFGPETNGGHGSLSIQSYTIEVD